MPTRPTLLCYTNKLQRRHYCKRVLLQSTSSIVPSVEQYVILLTATGQTDQLYTLLTANFMPTAASYSEYIGCN